MARYKEHDYSQGKFIPIHFDRQILPGTFEYSLHYLIDNEIDLSLFDLRYRNDETGAPANDPAILLKIILYAYSRGITSSRKIAQSCEENIIFMALSADTRPHFTTIAEFISSSGQEIIHLFLEILLICRNIRLTDERLEHIELDHPEMSGQIDKIAETLQNPEIVIRSRSDSEVELFYRYYSETPVGDKYMCVIVKGRGKDLFIITAYLTDTMKRGETLWQKR